MKYCKVCGGTMSDEASFCPSCGVEVDGSEKAGGGDVVVVESNGIKKRNIAMAIILSIITCGIYSIYWMIKVNDESLKLANEKGLSGGLVFLLSLLTCGLYSYFWSYKMGECTDKIKGQKGSSSILYLVLAILGLGIVNMVLMQDGINGAVNKGEN